MGRVRKTVAAATITAAIAAQGAIAQTPDPLPPPAVPPDPPAVQVQPPDDDSKSDNDKSGGGKKKGKAPSGPTGGTGADKNAEVGEEGTDSPADQVAAAQPLPAPASCGPVSVPAFLIPIYQQASLQYGLGPSGPSILASINKIESNFGQNQGPSSAGAVGWMQFMPATWDAYGVDANGDGVRDPSDPQDAIFAAARYLQAGGMPEDPEGAIFAYNHADWYVAEVLAGAGCFSGVGNGALAGLSLIPKRQELTCMPAGGGKDGEQAQEDRDAIPPDYLEAFQDAAGSYDLGEDGVWALAAVARLESDYGRGMTGEELERSGPLGLSDENWERYEVDGDGDGKAQRASIGDSSAALARMIWAAGGIREGIFAHNHASWYVQEVLDEAEPLRGKCRVRTVAYSVALPGPTSMPINWENLELSNELELWDLQQGAIDPRVVSLIAAISLEHTIRISSLRSDHSMHTTGGNVSNHFFGRAVDIAAIDGVPCTVTTVESPCGQMVRALAALPAGQMPTELIFCFDADGPGPAFAAADHCDHIHAGYDG
jgi:hypothetical protein